VQLKSILDVLRNGGRDMLLRNYSSTDLNAIEKINSFCAISIRYHGDIKEENVFCVVDDKDELTGVGYLKFNEKIQRKDKLIIEFSTSLHESHRGDMKIDGILMDGLINRFYEIKQAIPEKKLYLRVCCEADEINDMQFFMQKGFGLNSVIPVLKYDLSQNTKHYDIPEDVKIIEYSFNDESIKKYIEADILSGGSPESEASIRFCTGDPSFKCFAAICNSEVVGAISIWNITDKRAATENIFVVPTHRRKNIARELIATAFDELKSRGMEIATLSMSGTNLSAMKLYLSCGYSLYYNIIEMLYE
jgi:ribosomal protein S18 acetylase RimI-like enzyme